MATQTVGIKDFKNQATQLLRRVREEQTEIIVTHDGEPVAVLRPYVGADDAQRRAESLRAALVQAELLAAKLAKRWPKKVSAARAVAQQRR